MLKVKSILYVFGFLTGLSLYFSSCKSKEERLARTYCSICHLFPDPSLLDKKTWEKSVLPQMAFQMGFPDFEIMSEISQNDLTQVLQVIPKKPMVSEEEWNMIRNYYLTNAPDSLVVKNEIIDDTIKLFNVKRVQYVGDQLVTLLKIDTISKSIYVGSRSSKLYKLDNNFQTLDTILLDSPPSWLTVSNETLYTTTLGIMDPNDQAKGRLISINNGNQTQLIDSLKRPVYFERVDLNNDNVMDYVICSFGNFTGDLSVYESTAGGTRKHVLSHLPGARKIILHDFNNDNRMDILALITQGDEQIVLFTNHGKFNFSRNVLLKFPPVYGTSYFEIADFNSDGFPDILTVNGDNADYSNILKPYHAVRIFENNGKNSFNEVWSFNMPGASMAMARDFDQDGDLDIAAISFFPDFERYPERGLLYFENKGDYKFKPQTTKLANYGRWLVMETGDYDQDGDTDIIVGAMSFGGLGASKSNYNIWQQHSTSLLILENKTAQ